MTPTHGLVTKKEYNDTARLEHISEFGWVQVPNISKINKIKNRDLRMKNCIDKIKDKQHEPKMNLAKNRLSKYRAKTVIILNKKPKLANPRVNFIHLTLSFKFISCFSHSGGICFSQTYSSCIFLIRLLKV